MYGYIYRTTMLETGEVYIGKKKSDHFIPSYHGSGKRIKQYLKENGTGGVETVMLQDARSKEKLNKLEKEYIQRYKDKYGDSCWNLAPGGDGGDGHMHADEESKDQFRRRMTLINRERCSNEEFRRNTGERMRRKYSDPKEREKQSKRISRAWSDETLRKEQSERLKKIWANTNRNNKANCKPCRLELNGKSKNFDSIGELKTYLNKKYDIVFANPKLKELLDSEEPYTPFFKNKHAALNGMVLRWVK